MVLHVCWLLLLQVVWGPWRGNQWNKVHEVLWLQNLCWPVIEITATAMKSRPCTGILYNTIACSQTHNQVDGKGYASIVWTVDEEVEYVRAPTCRFARAKLCTYRVTSQGRSDRMSSTMNLGGGGWQKLSWWNYQMRSSSLQHASGGVKTDGWPFPARRPLQMNVNPPLQSAEEVPRWNDVT